MQAIPITRYRLARLLAPAALGLLAIALHGCSDVDWNWDTTWWDPPKRTVRPIPPSRQGEQSRDFAYAPKTSGHYVPRPADQRAERAADQPGGLNGGSASGVESAATPTSQEPRVSPPAAQAPPQPASAGAVSAQAFYQLYLASSSAAEQPVPGTARLILSQARPRAMASILEVLYPPMGRSGSDVESYLIYEQREEFDAARGMVSALDVPAGESGERGAFETGVGMYYSILGQDASVDRALVKSCQARLDEARQAAGADRTRRWAAAILKGRLATEYTYDYREAVAAFDDAAQIGSPGTLEEMVARWWAADALRMEGGKAKARQHLEEIVRSGGKWPQSQIFRRAKAAL